MQIEKPANKKKLKPIKVLLRPNLWENIPEIEALIKAPIINIEVSQVSSRTVMGLFIGFVPVSLLLSIGISGEVHE